MCESFLPNTADKSFSGFFYIAIQDGAEVSEAPGSNPPYNTYNLWPRLQATQFIYAKNYYP